MSFDLLERRWLPVWTRDGPDRVSLRGALERAHEVRLAGPPEEHTALLRLLLALYASAARPADTGEWDTAWRSPCLAPERTGAYLDAHAGRFDLFSPTRPFWQCAALSEPNREPNVLEIATWGSGAAQFASHLLMPPEPVAPQDAAVALVLLQSWHPGGIQSGHPEDPASRAGKVYGGKASPLSSITHLRIAGRTLKDELLLNCPPGQRRSGDRPVWERESPAAPMVAREPDGPLDLWTWPTRRVRLFQDEDDHVTDVAVHDGDRPADPGAAAVRWDPGAALTGRGTRLAVADAARHPLPWAAARILTPEPESGTCAVLEHLVEAAERGALPTQSAWEAVALRAEHTTAHRAALSGIVVLNAALGPAGVLGDPGRRAAFAEMAALPWLVQRQITRTASEALGIVSAIASARPGLSLAAHLPYAWEEFAENPDVEADGWVRALCAAVDRVADAVGRDLMAAARIRTDALAALPSPVDSPEEDRP
ncbi:type I-E CRISPR-associated protein Cse1/CasA [Streptomyces rubiginosohelvolus]|uniref:type I-E CRISPR-associated protein Cse1/CasA n=1 Tax=Streptomyces rubiginosohelvolus TaxID=67362 RepID=UPI00339E4425